MFETIRTGLYMCKIFAKARKIIRQSKKVSEQESWQMGYDFIRPYAQGIFKVAGTRIIYHGLENLPERKGVLYVGNHQSYLDIPAILAVMEEPTAFVSKDSVGKTPFLGPILDVVGCVSIVREDIRQSLNAIKEASQKLEKGLNMVIFPEGTRSQGPVMGEFKKGSIKAATMVGAPIVPFRIENMYSIFEGNKGIKVKPCEVHVYFGEMIDIASMSRAEQKELGGRMKEIVESLK